MQVLRCENHQYHHQQLQLPLMPAGNAQIRDYRPNGQDDNAAQRMETSWLGNCDGITLPLVATASIQSRPHVVSPSIGFTSAGGGSVVARKRQQQPINGVSSCYPCAWSACGALGPTEVLCCVACDAESTSTSITDLYKHDATFEDFLEDLVTTAPFCLLSSSEQVVLGDNSSSNAAAAAAAAAFAATLWSGGSLLFPANAAASAGTQWRGKVPVMDENPHDFCITYSLMSSCSVPISQSGRLSSILCGLDDTRQVAGSITLFSINTATATTAATADADADDADDADDAGADPDPDEDDTNAGNGHRDKRFARREEGGRMKEGGGSSSSSSSYTVLGESDITSGCAGGEEPRRTSDKRAAPAAPGQQLLMATGATLGGAGPLLSLNNRGDCCQTLIIPSCVGDLQCPAPSTKTTAEPPPLCFGGGEVAAALEAVAGSRPAGVNAPVSDDAASSGRPAFSSSCGSLFGRLVLGCLGKQPCVRGLPYK